MFLTAPKCCIVLYSTCNVNNKETGLSAYLHSLISSFVVCSRYNNSILYVQNISSFLLTFISEGAVLVLQGTHRPGKVLEFDLGPGKLLEFQNSAICPGIVLEFCKIALENVKLSLQIIKYTNSFLFF